MGDIKDENFEPGKFRQFLAAFVINLSALAYGTMVGWQSPVNHELQGSNPPVGTEPMSDEQISWLTGTMCLTGTFMTIFISTITDKLGRKTTGCLVAIPFSVSWLLTIFASSPTHLLLGRFFAGISGATTLYVVPLYVSEISSDCIRGMLGSLVVFILNFGILVAYVAGAYLPFQMFGVTMLVLPVIFLATFLFMPESPVHLVRKKRLNEAARSLMWLKDGHKQTVERELSRIQAEVKEQAATTNSVGIKDLFRDRATIKGLIITLGLFSGQQFCGIFAMISYTETIFRIAGSSLSPHTAAIIVAAIQVFGSYLSTSLMERTGRRLLLLISCAGMCICHYILGTFCYLQEIQIDVSSFSWIPVTALSVYMIAYCLGMGPGPYVVASEIFSRDVAGLGTTMGLLFVWFTAFIVVKFFALIVWLMNMYGCFYLLGTCCAASFVFVLLLLPETKGQPRELIVDMLNGIPRAFNDKEYVSSNGTDSKGLQPAALV